MGMMHSWLVTILSGLVAIGTVVMGKDIVFLVFYMIHEDHVIKKSYDFVCESQSR